MIFSYLSLINTQSVTYLCMWHNILVIETPKVLNKINSKDKPKLGMVAHAFSPYLRKPK